MSQPAAKALTHSSRPSILSLVTIPPTSPSSQERGEEGTRQQTKPVLVPEIEAKWSQPNTGIRTVAVPIAIPRVRRPIVASSVAIVVVVTTAIVSVAVMTVVIVTVVIVTVPEVPLSMAPVPVAVIIPVVFPIIVGLRRLG